MSAPAVRQEALRALRLAARASPLEWRHAVAAARRAGITYDEVMAVLFWWHPSTWVYLALAGILPALFVAHWVVGSLQ